MEVKECAVETWQYTEWFNENETIPNFPIDLCFEWEIFCSDFTMRHFGWGRNWSHFIFYINFPKYNIENTKIYLNRTATINPLKNKLKKVPITQNWTKTMFCVIQISRNTEWSINQNKFSCWCLERKSLKLKF